MSEPKFSIYGSRRPGRPYMVDSRPDDIVLDSVSAEVDRVLRDKADAYRRDLKRKNRLKKKKQWPRKN